MKPTLVVDNGPVKRRRITGEENRIEQARRWRDGRAEWDRIVARRIAMRAYRFGEAPTKAATYSRAGWLVGAALRAVKGIFQRRAA